VFWTEPYIDEAATFSLMMTVDAVMFDLKGKAIGMATVDWSLAKLRTFIDSVKVLQSAADFD
jgi:pyruvate-formate lyase-activating enzyme